jgi:hypothetical protein
MTEYRIKNWENYQHYSHRHPPWIKLHKTVLKDRAFMTLAPASRLLLMLLWVLASENKGVVTGNCEDLAFLLHLKKVNLDPLISRGFLIPASNMLATASAPSNSNTDLQITDKPSLSEKKDLGRWLPLAEKLDKQVKDAYPGAKEPNLSKWADVFRLIETRDKRTLEEIEQTLDWIAGDIRTDGKFPGWGIVIRSPEKLRLKWDDIAVQKQQKTKGADPFANIDRRYA